MESRSCEGEALEKLFEVVVANDQAEGRVNTILVDILHRITQVL